MLYDFQMSELAGLDLGNIVFMSYFESNIIWMLQNEASFEFEHLISYGYTIFSRDVFNNSSHKGDAINQLK